jgi:hypothetical protein
MKVIIMMITMMMMTTIHDHEEDVDSVLSEINYLGFEWVVSGHYDILSWDAFRIIRNRTNLSIIKES